MIRNYDDFLEALLNAGFSGAVGGKDDGAFALFRYGWGAEDETGIVWHTGNPDTDPWEWRLRILNERDDVAYAKLFFRKAGYITKEWYPYFLAARRGGKTFEEEYEDGTISHFSKRIYQTVEEHGNLPLGDIKRFAGFKREDKSKFDSALTDLQMKMYLTISGVKRNISQDGKEYGWTTTVFSTTEAFFGEAVFKQAEKISIEKACAAIREQILNLNSAAGIGKKSDEVNGSSLAKGKTSEQEKKIIKFIYASQT